MIPLNLQNFWQKLVLYVSFISLNIKKDGLCFISTINKTWQSYAVTILGAEYLTRIVPIGTHHYEKFMGPDVLRDFLINAGFDILDIQGFSYDPLNNKMSQSTDLSVNYFIAAKKLM